MHLGVVVDDGVPFIVKAFLILSVLTRIVF